MVVWYCDVDITEDADLTEGDIYLARTSTSPPGAQVLWRSGSVPGTLALPDRGSRGRQRGLGGHITSLIVIKNKKWCERGPNWRVFRLLSSFTIIKSAVMYMWFSVLFRYLKFVVKTLRLPYPYAAVT